MQNDTPQLPLFTIVADDLPPIVPITNKHIKDLTGRVFARLTVLGFAGQDQRRRSLWLVACECGVHFVIKVDYLVGGEIRSCGCLRREVSANKCRTHGLSDLPEYTAWAGMIDRCERVKNTRYARYGGRGITVCPEWRNDFEQFLRDMGPRPGPEYSVDRIDNDKGYSPDNCRWATPKVQRSNSCRIHLLEFQGERMTLTQWAEKLGIKRSTLNARIMKGWTTEKALTRPIGRW